MNAETNVLSRTLDRLFLPPAPSATPRQRVLRFCERYPEWHPLIMLKRIRLLEQDDHRLLDALVDQGMLEKACLGTVPDGGGVSEYICYRISKRGVVEAKAWA